MRKLLICAVVFAGQIGAVDGMYYLRAVRRNPVAESDFLVFILPVLGALYLHYTVVFGSWNQSLPALTVRVAASLALTFLSFYFAMLIALNTWGS
jgi:hypothetical protein